MVMGGYFGLFLISFLSATLLPLGSEVAVTAMSLAGYSPWEVLAVATVGNVGGALVNYALGRRAAALFGSVEAVAGSRGLHRAEGFYRRWGAPVLLLSWVPLIGDPLTLLAGAARVDLRAFCVWVTVGKASRYAVLLGLSRALLD